MEPDRTLAQWLADWLAVRRPTRLIVDGLIVLLLAGVSYMVWAVWYEVQGGVRQANPDRSARIVSILFSSVSHGAYYLGMVIVVVGLVRLFVEGQRGGPSSPSSSSGEQGSAA